MVKHECNKLSFYIPCVYCNVTDLIVINSFDSLFNSERVYSIYSNNKSPYFPPQVKINHIEWIPR